MRHEGCSYYSSSIGSGFVLAWCWRGAGEEGYNSVTRGHPDVARARQVADAIVIDCVADGKGRKAYTTGAWEIVGRTVPSGRYGDESAAGWWVPPSLVDWPPLMGE